jgi:RNA polymerase sigma factor (sigma-70 family)
MSQRSLPGLLLKAAIPDEGDAELLGSFVRERDHAAFAELVRRHGPMVLGVCRTILGDGPDADDAFQATFLVLIRKASSVSPRFMIGNWLYGVAWRTATHSRTRRAKLNARRQELPDVPDPRQPGSNAVEAACVVHAELAAMPDRFRTAIVLCELEGRTIAEAARLLGIASGTVASRLSRGRAVLASRLRKRGWGAAALLTFATPLSEALAQRVQELLPGPGAASGVVSPVVTELTDGVARAMLRTKIFATLRIVLGVCLLAGAVAWAGVAVLTAHPQSAPPGEPPSSRENEYRGPELRGPNQKDWMESLWDEMWFDEPRASRAMLTAIKYIPEKDRLAFLKAKLKPLKVEKADVKKWIADLDSDKDEVWTAAMQKLDYFDPLLVLAPADAMAEAKTHRAKHRLAALLTGRRDLMSGDPVRQYEHDYDMIKAKDGTYRVVVVDRNPFRQVGPGGVTGFQPKDPIEVREYQLASHVGEVYRPTSSQITRGVLLLEYIGNKEALAILKDMATGYPDALPTRTAKQAVAELTKPAP